MRVLCDTNIVLDVVTQRDPFYASSVQVLHMIEDGELEAQIPVTSLTDIFYIVRRLSKSNDKAYKAIELTRSIMKVCGVTAEDEERAFAERAKDYEDAIIAMTADSIGCDYILTRNTADFKGFKVKPITPEELLDKYKL